MASSTGVSNIRAMFEAKQQEQSTSPPSRGRSPAAMSDVNSIRSMSSRPVSKIRTSFVAVEKSGQLGGPILGLRRVSDVQDQTVIEGDARPGITRNASNTEKSIVEEKEKPDIVKNDVTKPESTQAGLEQAEVQVNGSDSKKIDETPVNGKLAQVKKQSLAPVKTKAKADTSKIQSPKATSSQGKKQPTTPNEIPSRVKADVKKPAALNIKSPIVAPSIATSKSMKTTPKTPTSAKTITKAPIKRDVVPKPESRVATPRTTIAPSNTKEKKPVQVKPKSPTKPGRLPAAAMASTASSAAKTASDRPSSRGSTKPRTSTDGDFLARMMRPTAASASKTHEKVTPKTTPQKPAVARPKRVSDVASKSGAAKTASMSSKSPVSPITTNVAVEQDATGSVEEKKTPSTHDTGAEKPTETLKLIDNQSETMEAEEEAHQPEIQSAIQESINEDTASSKQAATEASPEQDPSEDLAKPELKPDSTQDKTDHNVDSDAAQNTSINGDSHAETNGHVSPALKEHVTKEYEQSSSKAEILPLTEPPAEDDPKVQSSTVDEASHAEPVTEKQTSDEFLPLAVESQEQDKTTVSDDTAHTLSSSSDDVKPSTAEIEAKVAEEAEETY